MKHGSKLPESAASVLQLLTTVTNHLKFSADEKEPKHLHRSFKVHRLCKQILTGKTCQYYCLRQPTQHCQRDLLTPPFKTLFSALTSRKSSS